MTAAFRFGDYGVMTASFNRVRNAPRVE